MEKRKDKKKELYFELAGIVRKIQKQYIASSIKAGSNGAGDGGTGGGGGRELLSQVEELCNVMEAIFLHELKNTKVQLLWREMKRPNPTFPPKPSFWLFVDPMVPDEIKMQLHALRNSESLVRKCRSWVRLTLAKKLMISFLEDLQRHPGLLASHYGEGALLRDSEQSEIVIQLLRGLDVLQLHFDHTGSHLDVWEPYVLALAGIWEAPVAVGNKSEPSTPVSISSPAHYSPSIQRVSPPASDFDLEGVTIIDIALDKYSRKKSKNSVTDSELITKEIASRGSGSTPRSARREVGSFSSTGSGEGGVVTGAEPSGAAAPSYQAMLFTHAKSASGVVQGGGGGGGFVGVNNTGNSEEERGVAGGSGMGVALEEEELEGESEPAEMYSIALDLNYEIISSDGSFVESQRVETHLQQKSVMMDHLVKLVTEKGLDSQKYKCRGCNRDIGLIFGQAKLCKFNGQHYCFDCHRDDERIIPARVLFNWDFRPHKVCLASCEFLDSVELNPILDVEQVNRALYLYIPALEEALKLRQQCKYLKDYLVSCKECKKNDILDEFKRRLRSLHICEEIHKYSLKDFIDVNSGSFNDRLKKVVKFASKHVKQCMICSQRGFICEVCHDDGVIYPFDLADTCQCGTCKAVFHKVCYQETISCPKCERIRQRANSTTRLD